MPFIETASNIKVSDKVYNAKEVFLLNLMPIHKGNGVEEGRYSDMEIRNIKGKKKAARLRRTAFQLIVHLQKDWRQWPVASRNA